MAKKDDKDKKYKTRPELEAVEPRLLFSAGLEGVLAATQLETPPDDYHPTVVEQTIDQGSLQSTEASSADVRVELIFVDTDVPEYQTLLSDLLTYPDDTTRYEVFALDNTQDGLAQISAVLSGFDNVNAVHILSHGTEGAIDLGGSTLDNDALAANSELLQSWGNALTADADILVYGCNLAANEAGQQLIDGLAILTGADVAASDDLTGNAQLGGDWELEYQAGSIETVVAVSAELQESYQAVLAETVLESYEPAFTELSDTGYQINTSTAWGQTFQYNSGNGTYQVDQVGLVFSKDATAPAGQMVSVTLRDAWNGTVLGSGSISTDELTTAEAWYSIDVGNVTLSDNTTYVIQVETGTAEKVYLGVDDGGATYASGDMLNSSGSPNAGKDVAFRLQQANATPVIISDGGGATASVNVAENTTVVTTVTATDVDLDTVTYSISGGADAALFSVDTNSGALTFDTAPDFEAPADANTDNVHEVTVQASDGNGGTDTQTIYVTVTDVSPTTVSATGAATAAAGSSYTLNLNANEDITGWTINWGDGTIETIAGNPSSVTHTYVAGNEGLTYNILVSATDASGTHFESNLLASTSFQTGEGLYQYLGTGTFDQSYIGTEVTNPYAMTIGPDGLIYVAGHTSDNVVRYDASTGAYVDTFVAAGSGGLNAAAGLAFGPDGNLYVSNQIGDSILVFDGTTGAFLSTFVSAGSGGLNAPVDLEFRPDGHLYVGSYNTDSVLRYNASTGAYVDTFVTAGSGGLNGPSSFEWGPDGNLYIASNDGTVKRFDGATGAWIDNFVTAGSGGLGEASGLTFGPDGNLYVSSYTSDQIIRYDGATGALIGDYVTAGGNGLDGPTDILFMPSHQVTIDSNQAPALSGANDLAAINEDDVTNSGTLVSALIAGQVSDANAGSVEGVAVIAVDDTNGTWEYSTDGGGNWAAFGAVDASTARLLAADADTYVRFVPDADWNGTVTNGITFHAWDQTYGSNGGLANLVLTNTMRDEFTTVSYSNNDGSASWSGDWIEYNDDGSAVYVDSSDNIYVDNGKLHIDNLDGGSFSQVTRAFDLTSATGAILTMDYDGIREGVVGGDRFTVEVSNDGGASWVLLEEITVPGDTTANMPFSGSLSYNLESSLALTGDMVLRLSISAGFGGTNQHVNFDNVQIEYTSEGVGGTTAYSTATASSSITVNPVNDAPTGAVSIDNLTPAEGDTLTASNTLSDADGLSGPISYQWYADGVAIAGATGSTYTLTQSEVGAVITVMASYTDDQGTTESVSSTGTAAVTNVNNLVVGQPVITGALTEDQMLTADTSGISDADGLGAFSYQWYRDGVAIGGATASTYTLGDADVGTNITVTVSYTDQQGTAESTTSVVVGPVSGVNDAPVISGAGTVFINEIHYDNSGTDTGEAIELAGAAGTDLTGWSLVLYNGFDGTVYRTESLSGQFPDQSDSFGTLVFNFPVNSIQNGDSAPDGIALVDDTGAVVQFLSYEGSFTAVEGPAAGLISTDIGVAESGTTTGESLQLTGAGPEFTWAAESTSTFGSLNTGQSFTLVSQALRGETVSEDSALVFSTANGNAISVADIDAGATDTLLVSLSVSNGTLALGSTAGLLNLSGQGTAVITFEATASDINAALEGLAYQGDPDFNGSDTLTVVVDDQGNTGSGGALTDTASVAITVIPVNDALAGSVTIDNLIPAEGDTLTASNTLTDADGLSGPIGYQWHADGVAIGGATGSTYTLTQSEVGAVITVVASYTDDQGTSESMSSAGTAAVTNVNDAPTGSVTISGTPTEDQVLTASNTLADVDGMGPVSYQWYRDGVAIGGAAASIYTLDDADVGTTITVAGSYTDGQGTAESVTSAGVGPIANVNDAPVGVPAITGTVTEDQVLTADTSGISDADGLGAFSYQWLRDGVAIAGATGTTYTLGDADVGAQISVQVSYTDQNGTAESVTSAQTAAVTNINDAPTGSVTIDNLTPAEGDTLTASNSLADADGLSGAVSYQWYHDGVAIGGATGSTYTTVQADVGTVIMAVASYTDDQGTAESVSSAGTAAVINVNDAPTGSVTISGTPTEDQTLTASNTLADVDGMGPVSYQWYRDGVAIGGAAASTYTLGDADVGATITVAASYTDAQGTNESMTSAGVGPIANVNDAPVGLPVITGTVTEDQVLTADTSGISDADGLGAFSYQWLRDGVAIAGATGTTYTLGDADVGAQISVQVSYTDQNGTAESVTSAQTVAVANINDAPTGTVSISGTPTEDQVLTASNTLADVDGMGPVSYQWYRDGVAIGGATGSTYTLGDPDVGATITVTASYTDGQGTAESVTSAGVGPVANVNDAPVGVPAITGTIQEDQVLTADTSGISDTDGLGAFSYQWLRDGVAIGGATASTYTLGDADVGSQISVQVIYTDGQGTSEGPLTSAQTAAVANVNDTPVGVPVITGTATEDQVLTADTSGMSDADGLGAFSYQWYRDGVAVAGATTSTYTLGDADVGSQISVQVIYTDGQGTSEGPLTSAQTAAVANVNDTPVGVPVITGTATEDQVLTADTSGISDADGLGAFSYQWLRDGIAITGATASTYTLGDADVGSQISVQVSYTDGQGTSEGPLVSAQTAAVTNVNDAPVGVPVITGTATEDQVLMADTSGLSDADGLGAFSYQWLRDGVAIGGATGSTYTLGDTDVGAQISVQVSYTDQNGTNESVTSAQTAAVANINDAPTGSVTISGTPTEDQILTASNTLADADGMGVVSYQWYRDGVAIGGAAASIYTLGDADVGASITVAASYTDMNGTNESVISAGVGPIANINDAPVGVPTITGTVTEDQLLTADTTGISDVDGLGAFSYQWYRDGVAIGGANASTYTLGDADVGAQISVQVSYTDLNGTAESVTSVQTGAVANINDLPVGLPSITGLAQEDQVLTADTSGISDVDGLGAFSYQWYRDGMAIGGATASTYTLGDADVGSQISVRVSYTDLQGTAEGPLASVQTAAVANVNDAPTGNVTISGTPTEDQILTASNSLVDADGLGAISYQWYRDGVAIAGATNVTYTLDDADVGATITVAASYTDMNGTNESVTSAGVGPIANINDAPIGVPAISGTVTEDQVLTADTSGISDADGLGAFSYQWLRNGVVIAGATGSTYTLGDADVGAQISVQVSYTDLHGTSESVTSAQTAAVANINDAPTGAVTIDNTTPAEGDTLTASNTLADADGLSGPISYQWYRDGVAIGGATGTSYTTVQADVAAVITVVAGYTDDQGTAESVSSAGTAAVTNVNDAPTGSVTISGTPTEDQILTASNTLADVDGLGAIGYQWYRDGVAIIGAASSTYMLGDADVGTTITVTASYTDGQGTSESVTSAGVGPVANINDAPTGSVTIDNTTPAEGDTLTASNTLADADGLSGPISYQWYRDGVAIAGATSTTYTTTQVDVGTVITVVASYTDDQGTSESVSSVGTAAVTNINDAPTGSVTISGTPTEDQVLTAMNTLADVDGMGPVSYQWYRDGVAIGGATGLTYTLGDTDVGTTIAVAASYTDGQGTNESVTSAGVGPIANVNDSPVGIPVITGTVTEDQVLTADTSGISDADGLGALSYQWLRDGVVIAGATGSTYTLGDTDVGATITVEISYTDGHGTSESITSNGVGPVVNVNDVTVGQPVIAGMPEEDQILTVDTTGITDADGISGAFSYQWYRDGIAIAGANGGGYILGDADVGAIIAVTVGYIDDQGTSESISSAGVGPIANVNDAPTGSVLIDNMAPAEGDTLTVSNSLADADGLGGAIGYQWYRDGVAIAGATATTYTTVQSDVGTVITVIATYTDDQGTSENVSSAGTAAVTNVNNAPTGSVTIDNNTPAEGDTLTASNTLADVDGLSGPIDYQWYRDGVAIGGATGSSYTTAQADVGAVITVVASYTDDQGTAESMSSTGTAAVTNVNNAPTGAVNISGTPTEDQTLTVSNTLADVDGMGPVTYQWFRDGVIIAGATNTTYTLSDADVGATITVTASYIDGQGTNESVVSAGVGPIANVNDSPVGLPVITGTVTEDQVLTADTSGISDADGPGAFSYQWLRDGNAIAGATGSTYTLGDADVDSQISVQVSYTDAQGTVESVTSVQTAAVINVNDAPTGGVTIDNMIPAEGDTLTVSNTLADVDGLSGPIDYQWYRDGVAISGATGSTYATVQADVGTVITVVASYTDDQGTSESVSSPGTATVININNAPTGSVIIDNMAPAEGDTLTVSDTLADIDGLSGAIGYQWYRDGVAIAGATGATFTATQADVGAVISVVASYTDDQGTNESVSSAGTAPVTNVNDAPTGSVSISGTPTEDQTLTASNTLADIDGLGGISYQWSRDGVAIAGATGSTYTLGDADVGTTITVAASYTDGQGTNESVASAGVGPIANINDAPVGLPVISGTVAEDQVLTADTSGISDADGLGAFGYQWLRDGAAIAGATGSTYTLGDTDVGSQISVTAGYIDANGTAESLTSAQTLPVVNVNDIPMGAVTIDNLMPGEGDTVSASHTLADADGISGPVSYQWYRDGVAISGATGSTYTTGQTDVGTVLTVVASYTDDQGALESVSSVGALVAGVFVDIEDDTTGETVEPPAESPVVLPDIVITDPVGGEDQSAVVLEEIATLEVAAEDDIGYRVDPYQYQDDDDLELDEVRKDNVMKHAVRVIAQTGYQITEEMLQLFDLVRIKMSEVDDQPASGLIKSVGGLALSVSAGVVSWVLRGGALAATMLSSVTVLKGFDPLPVMDMKGKQGKRSGEEDDSDTDVNEMFEEADQEEKGENLKASGETEK